MHSNRTICPLDPDLCARLLSLVREVGDQAAAEHVGVQPLTVCRAALGLPLQPRVRALITAGMAEAVAA